MDFDNLETRSASQQSVQGSMVEGYAAVFNSPAIIAGQFVELIKPGAFARSLRSGAPILALWGHDRNWPLGRRENGTLDILEDAHGLHFALNLDPSTPAGAMALGTVARQDCAGCSFGFRVLEESWRETNGLPERTLVEIELMEISLTADPAYPDTAVALRNLTEARQDRAQNSANARRRLLEASRRRARMEQQFRGLV